MTDQQITEPNIDTQNHAILRHLKHAGPLTPLQALANYGCFRLGARIYDLRQMGHSIASEMTTLANGKRCKRYWLETPETQAKKKGRLKQPA